MTRPTDKELALMRAAYLAMLRLSPTNPARLWGQNVLCRLRDDIALMSGASSQDVQEGAEAVVEAEREAEQDRGVVAPTDAEIDAVLDAAQAAGWFHSGGNLRVPAAAIVRAVRGAAGAPALTWAERVERAWPVLAYSTYITHQEDADAALRAAFPEYAPPQEGR